MRRKRCRDCLSGTLATMGPGVVVIGAKFAHPDRPALAIVGDGAMCAMNGMAELITAAKYWPESEPPN